MANQPLKRKCNCRSNKNSDKYQAKLKQHGFNHGSMSKTLKLEGKTPKKKLLKKTMTKTRKSDFFSIFLFEFLSVNFF